MNMVNDTLSMPAKRAIKRVFKTLGYEVRRLRPAPGPQDECERLIATIRPHTMVPTEGLTSLYNIALKCETESIPGSYVECGVWKGGCVALMAMVNLRHGSARRHIHLFDSFQEICEPDESIDGERALTKAKELCPNGQANGRLIPMVGFYDSHGGTGSLEDNQRLLEQGVGYDRQYLHYYEGWFQDTLPGRHDEVGDIAILRLDADWYASTKICLDYLFDKVVPGGFVIIDDYGTYDGCQKAVDEFFEARGRPVYLNYVNKDIRYMVVS